MSEVRLEDARRVAIILRCTCYDGSDCRGCEAVALCHKEPGARDVYAADLIERLAWDNAKYAGVGAKYEQEIAKLTRERDAVMRDLLLSRCSSCAHHSDLSAKCCDCEDHDQYEWRGVCAENAPQEPAITD